MIERMSDRPIDSWKPQDAISEGDRTSACLLIRWREPDYAMSAEFEFLETYVKQQIIRAFGSVRSLPQETTGMIDALGTSRYVLLLGNDRILLTANTLKRMKQSVDEGAFLAAPTRINSIQTTLRTPLYTLRQYEELEQQFLSDPEAAPHALPHQLPVKLLSVDSFRELLASSTLENVMFHSTLPHSSKKSESVQTTGLYYQFIDYYGQPREDIIQFVPEHSKNVLEIGCGKGLTGKLLQERLGCRVTGVELNSAVAEQARLHLWRVITGDVESIDLERTYDAVVATELFEHLRDPMAFLSRLKLVLSPKGTIVLSVPNVGHWSIVEDLLRGRWDYLPIGLLCYGHLRFFTRSTLEDWIQFVGFSSWEITPQTGPLPDRFSKLATHLEMDIDSLKTTGFYIVLHK